MRQQRYGEAETVKEWQGVRGRRSSKEGEDKKGRERGFCINILHVRNSLCISNFLKAKKSPEGIFLRACPATLRDARRNNFQAAP